MVMTIIVFILVFGVVVISHELGHFLIAKLNGIRVLEFAIGMGPSIVKFTKRGDALCPEAFADWRGVYV